MKGGDHSTEQATRPWIASTCHFAEPRAVRMEDGGEAFELYKGVRISLELPHDFSVEAKGKQLLQRIREAMELYGGDSDDK